MPSESRLANFPISWFAVVMGLAGLTIAWSRAETALNLPIKLSGILIAFTAVVFVLLAVLYAAKVVRYPDAVLEELKHPVKLSFFATFSISLILVGTALLHTAPVASKWIWIAGTVLHLVLTLYVLTVWMHHTQFEIQHFNPAWFIPIVGNVLIPIAGVDHAPLEVSWFFFSIGLVFWIVLMTIFMYRVIFHHPLPDRMVPTLFILIAPPALGCVSWVLLTGGVDPFARILYYCGLFLTLLLATQIRRFARLEFFLSWWAYSFPMAAITSATLVMFQGTHLAMFKVMAYVLLTALTLLIGGLAVRTCLALARQEISVTEG